MAHLNPALAPEFSLIYKPQYAPVCQRGLGQTQWPLLVKESCLIQGSCTASQSHLTPPHSCTWGLHYTNLFFFWAGLTLGHPCLSGMLPIFPHWNHTHPLRFTSNEASSKRPFFSNFPQWQMFVEYTTKRTKNDTEKQGPVGVGCSKLMYGDGD